ncbi:MAG: prolyl oligopeptidase family serine peptidase [Vulcanimicrobiota bacterium]
MNLVRTIFTIALCVSFLFICARHCRQSRAAEAQLIPREILFGNPEKAGAELSPDGKKLAYCAPDKGVLNVWIATVGKDDAVCVTEDRKRGIRSYTWQRDGKHILYIQDKDGDENFHIYQTDIASKKTRDLTPYQGIRAQIMTHIDEHPDTLLAFINVRDKKLFDVYSINLVTGEAKIITENPGDVSHWVADNTLTVRAALATMKDGSNEIRIRDSAGSPWKVLERWHADETGPGIVSFTSDNQHAYMLSSVDSNTERLLLLNLKTGEKTVLASDPSYDVTDVLIHPDTHKVVAVQFERERKEWMVIDKDYASDFEALSKMGKVDFSLNAEDLSRPQWIVFTNSDTKPAQYFMYDRKSRKASFLFSCRPNLEKYTFSPMEPISFKSRDGLTIHGYLTLPAGLPPHNLPTVLDVHGGPWGRDAWGFNREVQWLANRGYAVLQLNFRGSTGYGKSFKNAGNREWAAKMHDDLLDGKKWVIEKGYADPKKVCIYGGSYGGYATLVGLAFTPDEFCCGVDIVGPSNLVTLLKSFPPYWESMKSLFERRVGKLSEEEFLKSRSPLFKADQMKAPLLIAQGANDPRVKQAESDQIVEVLRKKGKEVEYLLFADEGHGFARPENNMKFYAACEAFLSRNLGGRCEPPQEKEKWENLRR